MKILILFVLFFTITCDPFTNTWKKLKQYNNVYLRLSTLVDTHSQETKDILAAFKNTKTTTNGNVLVDCVSDIESLKTDMGYVLKEKNLKMRIDTLEFSNTVVHKQINIKKRDKKIAFKMVFAIFNRTDTAICYSILRVKSSLNVAISYTETAQSSSHFLGYQTAMDSTYTERSDKSIDIVHSYKTFLETTAIEYSKKQIFIKKQLMFAFPLYSMNPRIQATENQFKLFQGLIGKNRWNFRFRSQNEIERNRLKAGKDDYEATYNAYNTKLSGFLNHKNRLDLPYEREMLKRSEQTLFGNTGTEIRVKLQLTDNVESRNLDKYLKLFNKRINFKPETMEKLALHLKYTKHINRDVYFSDIDCMFRNARTGTMSYVSLIVDVEKSEIVDVDEVGTETEYNNYKFFIVSIDTQLSNKQFTVIKRRQLSGLHLFDSTQDETIDINNETSDITKEEIDDMFRVLRVMAFKRYMSYFGREITINYGFTQAKQEKTRASTMEELD